MNHSSTRRLILTVAAVMSVCLWGATAVENAAAQESSEWRQLFNGKDLTGWRPKIRYHDVDENYKDTFRVQDGLLTVSYDQYDEFNETFGHLIYEKPFSDYVLRVEYRFIGDQVKGGPGWALRNSGVMLHGEAPETMGKDQDFPVSIEAQILGGDGTHPRTTANVCTPGTNIVLDGKLVTRHCNSSTSKTYHGDQWVTLEMEVHGNERIRHIMDGKVVFELTKPQLDERDAHAKTLIKNGDKMLSGGYISLQSESHPIQFRKVEIKELK